MVDNAKVTMTDIVASNGVIHVIDTVILPSESGRSAGAGSEHAEIRLQPTWR